MKTIEFIIVKFDYDLVKANQYLYKVYDGNFDALKFKFDLLARPKIATIHMLRSLGYKSIVSKKNQILKGINKLFNDMQEVNVCGKPFPEWLAFEGISLWQFVTCNLDRDVLYDVIEIIEYLGELINHNRPDELVITGFIEGYQKRTIELIASSCGVKVKYLPDYDDYYLYQQHTSEPICDIKIKPISGNDICSIVSSAPKALLITNPGLWKQVNGKDFIDLIYEPIYEVLKGMSIESYLMAVPYYETVADHFDAYKKSLVDNKKYHPLFFEAFKILFTEENYQQHLNRLEYNFKIFSNDDTFITSFTWKGISLLTPLYSYWHRMFTQFLLECQLSMYTARNILTVLKPNIVFAVYEVGVFARSIIIEAARAGIPSVGLQHAIIIEEHEYYLENHQTNVPDLINGWWGYVCPSSTFIFGEYYKKVLTNIGDYPSTSIRVVGDWRQLITNQSKPILSHTKKKIALILTAGFNEVIFSIVGERLDPREYLILIKPHPRDTTFLIYNEILLKKGFETIITQCLASEAISNADLIFVPCQSTTVLDCLLQDKVPYVYSGVDLGYTLPWYKFMVNMEQQADFKPIDLKPEEKSTLKKLLVSLGYNIEDEFSNIKQTIQEAVVTLLK